MEEDILQVVKYCTELVEDKDLEKLYLVIKYMKRYYSELAPLLPAINASTLKASSVSIVHYRTIHTC